MSFNAESNTDQVLEGIELSGKTAVVTGASGGLGAETARALASKGATVILAARNAEKTQQVIENIKSSTGNDKLSFLELHLDDLEQIRSTAQQLLSTTTRIDILINNAGIMACPLMRTKQGFETQFGVNHMGHFLFTTLLLPAIEAAKKSRVIMLSSGGHKYGCVNLNDPNWETTEYNKWQAYGAAKSANALFAVALNERYASKGISAFAVHPGVIFTDLGRHLTAEDIEALSGSKNKDKNSVDTSELKGKRGKLVLKTVEQGAATSVWAATNPELDNKGGLYLEDCHIAEQVDDGVQENGYYSYLLDKDIANKLWVISENLLAKGLTS